jgi:hypothetical protein
LAVLNPENIKKLLKYCKYDYKLLQTIIFSHNFSRRICTCIGIFSTTKTYTIKGCFWRKNLSPLPPIWFVGTTLLPFKKNISSSYAYLFIIWRIVYWYGILIRPILEGVISLYDLDLYTSYSWNLLWHSWRKRLFYFELASYLNYQVLIKLPIPWKLYSPHHDLLNH